MTDLLERPAEAQSNLLTGATIEAATIGQVLRGAADRLERVGWCQGTTQNAQKNECTAQALYTVAHQMDQREHLYGDALMVLSRFVGAATVTWNDTPGRTADEVTTNLRKCADQIDPTAK